MVREIYLVWNAPVAGWILFAITKLSFVFSLHGLWKVSTEDPGVIPRRKEPPPDLLDPYDPVPDRPRDKRVMVNGQTVSLKYCGE